MNMRERIATVYQGKTPDRVPLMLDLSHWYKKNHNIPFNLTGFKKVDMGLVELHRQVGAGAYCEMGGFYTLVSAEPAVKLETGTDNGVFTTRITTPLGSLHEERVFNPDSYSYGIRKHLLESTDDFPIVEFMMERLQCRPNWELFHAWQTALGELASITSRSPPRPVGTGMTSSPCCTGTSRARDSSPTAAGRHNCEKKISAGSRQTISSPMTSLRRLAFWEPPETGILRSSCPGI
ncbi:MAG: hypothetical protein WCP55_00645 [Lentisphaerota bacterium]